VELLDEWYYVEYKISSIGILNSMETQDGIGAIMKSILFYMVEVIKSNLFPLQKDVHKKVSRWWRNK